MEIGAKIGDTGSPQPSPDCSGPFVAEAVVWLPGQVAAKVVGQRSIVTRGLAIVCLYIPSHTVGA